MNTVALTGNLTTDPEIVDLPNGDKVLNFRFANNEIDRQGNPVLNGFFDVRVFQTRMVEACGAILKNGMRVTVLGRLNHRQFEREDGTRGGRTQINAIAIGLSLEFETPAQQVAKTSERAAAREAATPIQEEAPAPEPTPAPSTQKRGRKVQQVVDPA